MLITAQQNDHALATLRSDVRLAADAANEAGDAMPVMTVDWFGPASEAWQRTATGYRSRVLGIQGDTAHAVRLANRIGT